MFLIPLSLFLILFQVLWAGGVEHLQMPPNQFQESSSIEVIVLTCIVAVVAGPVYEEFFFRGVFLKRKVWVLTALIGSVLFILFVGSIDFSTFILIPYLTCFLVWFCTGRKKKALFSCLLLLNAILFQSLHVEQVDFYYLITYSLFLLGMGFVFIAQWLVLNYNLWFSIIFHSIWNFLLFTVILLELQIPDRTVHTIENECFQIEWQETALFGDKKIYFHEDGIREYKTYLVKELSSNDQISKDFKGKYHQIHVNQRYNFLIRPKDSCLAKNTERFFQILFDALENEGLIKEY